MQAKVRGGSPGGRSETTGVRFLKQVGFKPGVKDRRSYRCTEWWRRRGRSDGWRNRWVGNGRTGARMMFTKRQRELIPETRRSITEGAISTVIFREDDEGGRSRITTDHTQRVVLSLCDSWACCTTHKTMHARRLAVLGAARFLQLSFCTASGVNAALSLYGRGYNERICNFD